MDELVVSVQLMLFSLQQQQQQNNDQQWQTDKKPKETKTTAPPIKNNTVHILKGSLQKKDKHSKQLKTKPFSDLSFVLSHYF